MKVVTLMLALMMSCMFCMESQAATSGTKRDCKYTVLSGNDAPEFQACVIKVEVALTGSFGHETCKGTVEFDEVHIKNASQNNRLWIVWKIKDDDPNAQFRFGKKGEEDTDGAEFDTDQGVFENMGHALGRKFYVWRVKAASVKKVQKYTITLSFRTRQAAGSPYGAWTPCGSVDPIIAND